MSTSNPAERPWRRPASARFIVYAGWAVTGVALAVQGWYGFAKLAADGQPFVSEGWLLPHLQGDAEGGLHVAAWAEVLVFTVPYACALGMVFVDSGLARFRDASEASAVARLFGTIIGGSGVGAILATRDDPPQLLGALLATAAGLAFFLLPQMLDARRTRRERRHARVRAAGVSTTAVITETRTFYRGGEVPTSHYRVTLRFTDRSGRDRWYTETAPPGITSNDVAVGRRLPLHYDPSSPGRRRTIVVTWSSALRI